MENQKKIRFGIISTAGIANKLYDAFVDSSKAEVVAVSSRSVEKAQKWANERGGIITKVFGTYDELLADKEIDAVYIPLPTGMKYEWAKKSLESGKHVMVEKPLSGHIDTKQLQDLLKLSQEKNLQFMDCTMWVHSDRTRILKEKLNKGELGKVTKVLAALTFNSGEEFLTNNIRIDTALEPLGALGDVTWYSCMASLWAFNFEAPERVQAVSWKKMENGAILECNGILYFSNNRIAFVEGSFTEAHRQNFEIVGENGAYRIDDFVGGQDQSGDASKFVSRHVGGGNYKYLNRDGKAEVVEIQKSDQVVNMVDEFVDRINSNDQTQYLGKRTLLCQQVVIHLNLSMQKNGEILKFDQTL